MRNIVIWVPCSICGEAKNEKRLIAKKKVSLFRLDFQNGSEEEIQGATEDPTYLTEQHIMHILIHFES